MFVGGIVVVATRPDIDAFDLNQRLNEYTAILDDLRYRLREAVDEVNAAQDAFYAAKNTMEKAKQKMRLIQSESRNIAEQSSNTQSVLRSTPR